MSIEMDSRQGIEVPDANIFDLIRGKKTVTEPSTAMLTTDVDSFDYNMENKYRGTCLIINHKKFEPSTQCRERSGTDNDWNALKNCFTGLGFFVRDLQDPGLKEINMTLDEIALADHGENDCFACCILTHGEEGYLWAKDIKYPIESVFRKFRGDACPTLAGKPKIFIIQACRGDKLDAGVKIIRYKDVADSATIYRIPTWADFLMAYSCVPGYYSWRNTVNGSWFIQSLTAVIKNYAHQLDLLSMLTIVNKEVSYYYESCVPGNKEFDKKKQVSCITSMLTRRIIFTPKVFQIQLPSSNNNNHNEKQPQEKETKEKSK